MSILVVGDGPRDQSALPALVLQILGLKEETRYDDWHRVHYLRGQGSIHARKVKYLTRRARVDKFAALAIVADTDRSLPREKLRELRAGRDDDRQKHPPFPTALGEANPHFDVWLLDDPVAVREALNLPRDVNIPNARTVNDPKSTLSNLIDQSDSKFEHMSNALEAIATRLDIGRCAHNNDTGFAVFVEDVEHEIRPAICS